nr:peptidoglycan-binding protein [Desulfosarcina cetonica]
MRKRNVKPFFYRILSLILLSILFPGVAFCMPEDSHGEAPIFQIRAIIRLRIEEGAADTLTCQGETLCGVQLLPQAYQKRGYMPLWVRGTQPMQHAQHLADIIGRADEDGLDPGDYHQAAIQKLMAAIAEEHAANKPVPPEWLADLDLVLTDTFLLFGTHLSSGRVNPETLHTDWKIKPGTIDLIAALERFTTPGADMDAVIDGLRPPYREYHALRKALADLRALAAASGWPPVTEGSTLRPGEHNPAIATLRHRLVASGDMDPSPQDSDKRLFDASLEAAVKRFQKDSGLEPDGVVGRKTFAMLNVPVEQRIRQVVINLERWRWLPRKLGNRYVMINTANFRLKAVESGHVAVSMRVVVGRPARRSPVFSANITYLVINPYWNVPPTIAAEDILPELKKDVAYLAQHNLRVFQGWQSVPGKSTRGALTGMPIMANGYPSASVRTPVPTTPWAALNSCFPTRFPCTCMTRPTDPCSNGPNGISVPAVSVWNHPGCWPILCWRKIRSGPMRNWTS